MEHYKSVEKKYGKKELGKLIHNALIDFTNNKSDEGQKMKRFIAKHNLVMPAIDVFFRLTAIQDKVILLSKIRKCLVSFKSDLRALLTMFDIKTTDDSDLEFFLHEQRYIDRSYR